MSKYEVCRLLNISSNTLHRYLNVMYLDDLKKLDYHPRQKLLTPKQLNFLHKKIDLTNEPED